ncbi:hypothetical protein DUI87_06395 [Hirundo rustica rustica]|uniref:Uncharacterized protein n=1 Tax=Hirundo rustica rustica TaxID=333673 RepID=A0A3M0KVT6_HIRRU|nr:hypothetical protein DUI87_06395 [Hirundo rustica rustica]
MALALRLILLLLLAVALPARTAQAAPWRAQGADWNLDMDYLEALAHNHFKSLEDAKGKLSVCLSCQNNPYECGKSSPMCYFPYHDLKPSLCVKVVWLLSPYPLLSLWEMLKPSLCVKVVWLLSPYPLLSLWEMLKGGPDDAEIATGPEEISWKQAWPHNYGA